MGYLARQGFAMLPAARPLTEQGDCADVVEAGELLTLRRLWVAILLGQIHRSLAGGEEQGHPGAGQARHQALHRVGLRPASDIFRLRQSRILLLITTQRAQHRLIVIEDQQGAPSLHRRNDRLFLRIAGRRVVEGRVLQPHTAGQIGT